MDEQTVSRGSPGQASAVGTSPDVARPLRPWQRLSVRLAAFFAVVTLLAVGAVGLFTYQRQQREVQDTVGTQLLNIARVAALLIDPACTRRRSGPRPGLGRLPGAAEAPGGRPERGAAHRAHPDTRRLRPGRPAREAHRGERGGRAARASLYPLAAELIDPLRWTFEDGVARNTARLPNPRGTWITAFAPILDARAGAWPPSSRSTTPSRSTSTGSTSSGPRCVYASAIGAVGTLILGLLFARRLTRPIRALTGGVTRVAGGDLSEALPVRSRGRARPADAGLQPDARRPPPARLHPLGVRTLRVARGRPRSARVPRRPAVRRREARRDRAHVRPARLHAIRRAGRPRARHGRPERATSPA